LFGKGTPKLEKKENNGSHIPTCHTVFSPSKLCPKTRRKSPLKGRKVETEAPTEVLAKSTNSEKGGGGKNEQNSGGVA